MTQDNDPQLSTFLRAAALRATLPILVIGRELSESELRQTIIWMLGIATVAFLVCGWLLWLFWESLAEESGRDEVRFSPKSWRRLLYLIGSLIAFGIVFSILAYRAP